MIIDHQIIEFLAGTAWATATSVYLPADFSPRRFWRLTKDHQTAILMQAPPEQKTLEFLHVAALLHKAGIVAPRIIAADAAQGLVLMEDFGDGNLGKLLDAGQTGESDYQQAIALLAKLHQAYPTVLTDHLPRFDAALFAEQVLWFLDFYWPYAKGSAADDATRESFRTLWLDLLRPLEKLPLSLLLRDYMPDNLMRLADGRLGVLDFQDAGWGPVAYDIASLCECVRRDVPLARLEAVIDHYLNLNPILARADLQCACYLLSAQRHLRVLGNIARFATDPAKNFRLTYQARIWHYLEQLMQHDALAPLRQWLNDAGFVNSNAMRRSPQPVTLSDTAMVLAAGLGMRMRPLTLTKPKPLYDIAGRTMMDLALDRLKAQGIRRVVVNTHYLAEQIADHLAQRHDLEIIISHEPDLLDTGGGIKKVLGEFSGKPFFVLSADLPLIDGAIPALQRMAEAWDPARMDNLLLVMLTARAQGFDAAGDFYMKDTGQLYRKTTQPPRPYVMLSAQIMKPELFASIAAEKFSNAQIWDDLETQGRLYGLVHDGTCYHVGTPHDWEEANRLVKTGQGWLVT